MYAKTITSATGLTVDLPSPDSGIGAESITPRDQNNIQQVILLLNFPLT
jgi:transcription factor CP2-like protein